MILRADEVAMRSLPGALTRFYCLAAVANWPRLAEPGKETEERL